MSGRRMPTLDGILKEARTQRSGGPLSSFANTVDKNNIPANQSWTSHSYGHATQHNDPYRVYCQNNGGGNHPQGRSSHPGDRNPPGDGDDDLDDNDRRNGRRNSNSDPRHANSRKGNHNVSGDNRGGNGPPDSDPDPNGNGINADFEEKKDPCSPHSKVDSDNHAFNTHQWQLNAKISLLDVLEWDGGPLSIIDYIAKMNDDESLF
ncbi:hypothetical protein VKT23_011495 [Stygiomarasmius scandens]|uniref:Uncharacterized protein n=1 Tax=Marasmiellus scandens TaxID=2682957 RepID=A0ABR1J8F8_9AGAR